MRLATAVASTAPAPAPRRSLSRGSLIVLALIVALACVPRLAVGFGVDGDAVRCVQAGETLIHTGVYRPSRLPGNPLFEAALGLVAPWGGAVAANSLVLASFILALVAFARLSANRDNAAGWLFLFGCTPILLVDAATTMDYVPGLAAMLWAYVFVRRGRVALGGLLLGVAVGCRLPNILFAAPLSLYLLLAKSSDSRAFRRAVVFSLVTVGVGAALFAPIFHQVSWRMFVVPPSAVSPRDYAISTVYQAIQLFGLVGTIVVFGVVLSRAPALARSLRADVTSLRSGAAGEAERESVVELLTIGLFVALFVRHSDEPDYLVPVIPFLYLWLAKTVSRKQVAILCVAIASYALVDINLKGGSSGHRRLAVAPAWGIVVEDYRERAEIERLRSGIARLDALEPAVVLTGMGTLLNYHNPLLTAATVADLSPRLDPSGILESGSIRRLRGRNVFFVYGLSASNVRILKQEQYRVYIFSERAPSTELHVFHFDPKAEGLTTLPILDERAFYH